MKQEHKDYITKNNINSVEELKKHLEYLKEYRSTLTKEGEQMFRELSCMLYEDRESVLSFFAAKNKIGIISKAQEIIDSCRVPLNSNGTDYVIVTVKEDRKPDYIFSWRPSQKTESTLNVKPVHSNPWNDVQYCPRKERIKDTEKEKEKPYYELDLSLNYDSPLSLKQKDKVTTEDLKVFKNPAVKDCTIKNGKVEYGVKETEGKLDYSEINFEILDLMARRFAENKHKYPKGNSKKPLDKQEILWASFRHIRKMLQPIENDPETYEEHLSAIATNMSILLDQLRLNKS